ncbi:MAG: hypothetical protein IJX99_09700 [Clostridia bacterium]|nr:hypothetical protein [Clostridia bacterium]
MSQKGYSIEKVAKKMAKWWTIVLFAEKRYSDFGTFCDSPDNLFPRQKCTEEEKEAFRNELERRIIEEYNSMCSKGQYEFVLETDYHPNRFLCECLQKVGAYDSRAYYFPTKAVMYFTKGKVRYAGCKFASTWHEQKID